MTAILYTLVLFFLIRIVSLLISISNEKRILKQGAVQYGRANSFLLSILHISFYSASFYEAYIQHTLFDIYSQVGLCLLIFAYTILFYVIYELREIWTVKLYILPNQKIVKSFLFRTVKHPNYFLNIIPELIGVGLLCHAWKTMLWLLPVYLVVLGIRIYQEEHAMRQITDPVPPVTGSEK
ncbi:hypothetical protein GNY06_04325 [Elizabethkingia argentiflava]|uniref:Isoprenylcysteine carboxyl methyltransferase n=1 Tax=Elizabethkingia argenteiflava TaxID=2681556 RepID=A0A845PS31_9FLAO|nr:isoprenylcysteine carboxyl methyltransferase family protein [Elizabethkingia argenteiflava]NAW50644.1 hypothetical protein [Elizabethkingia argenteiflava]